VRYLPLTLVLAAIAIPMGGCSDDEEPSPPGSADNPLPAQPQGPAPDQRSNEAPPAPEDGQAERPTPAETPGYQQLLEAQARRPAKRFTPCNLVTVSEASTIVGGTIQPPVEAPQGPTCIYRSPSGEYITVAVQAVPFKRMERQLRRPQRVAVSDRMASCGEYGKPMLYVQLPKSRVLTISAPCAVARQFATKAVARLTG
jgi:hypothetical protein